MKFLVLSILIVWQVVGSTSRAVCQETIEQTKRLHFSFPFLERFMGRFEMTASSAQWVSSNGTPLCAGCESDSILQLRGNVEVRTIVC